MDLDLDINSDIYTLEINDKFTAALASTLALDGSPDTGTYDQSGAPSLLDQYEYAMCGKLFKWKQEAPKVRHRRHRSRRSRSRSLATLTTRSHASYVLLLLLTRCACLLLLSRAPSQQPVELQISYGGLLMRLKGDARHLAKLTLDSRMYLLIRKIAQ